MREGGATGSMSPIIWKGGEGMKSIKPAADRGVGVAGARSTGR